MKLRRVESPEAGLKERFGSPTLRINKRDVDPSGEDRGDFGLKRRLYRTNEGLVGIPPDEWALAAPRRDRSP